MGPEFPLQRAVASGWWMLPEPPVSTASGGMIPSPNDDLFVGPEAGDPGDETCMALDPAYDTWVLSLE